MSHFRFSPSVKVHPTTCTCKMCSKRKKERRKEARYVFGGMYGLLFLVIVISVVL